MTTGMSAARADGVTSGSPTPVLTTNGSACSGKTVDEVWNAIKASQAQPNYEQPFTVGHLLEGIGVGLPESPREPIQAAQLQLMQQFGQQQLERRQPQVHQASLPEPPQLQIHSQGLAPSFSPVQYAGQQRQLNDRPAASQQHPQPQQFSQQQYSPQQPQHAQQHFRQPPPAHQQSQHQAQDTAQQRRSPARSRGSDKGLPDKAQAVDSIAVNVRANSQYSPAQQVLQPCTKPYFETLHAFGIFCFNHSTKSLYASWDLPVMIMLLIIVCEVLPTGTADGHMVLLCNVLCLSHLFIAACRVPSIEKLPLHSADQTTSMT